MRVLELINELQKYPIDAHVKMLVSEENKSECPGYDMVTCIKSDINNTYYKKDEKFPMSGILYLMNDTKDMVML